MTTSIALSSWPGCGAMSILISHSNALIAAGLVATLQKLRDCEVQCVATGGRLGVVPRRDDVDLIIADADSWQNRSIDRSTQEASSELATARPQIVLLTAAAADGAGVPSLPEGVSACLPSSCGQDDLLKTVCGLIGTTVRVRAVTGPGEALSASIPRAERPRGGIAPSALQRVRMHIEQNLCEHIDIDALATMTGLSTCHFSRAFKQSIGVPPHRYVLSRRVLAAAALIKSTDWPMSEIALEVGFSDQSHFTRVFSAHMGESPRRFRHLHR